MVKAGEGNVSKKAGGRYPLPLRIWPGCVWWQMEVAHYLRAGAKYGALRKELANITDAVLATTLKELMADGMLERRAFNEIPPHVEYSLTAKGASVVPILQSICQWSGMFYKEEGANIMTQCQRCDYK